MKFEFTKQFKIAILNGKFNMNKVSPKFWTLTSIRKNGRKLETQKIKFEDRDRISEDNPYWKYVVNRDSFVFKYKALPSEKFKNPKHDLSHFILRYKDMIIAKCPLEDLYQDSDFITIVWDYPFIRID